MSAAATSPAWTENVDRRVLGAVRFADSITGSTVAIPLTVAAPGLVLRQNRSGVWVAFSATGLEALTEEFLPPATWPAATSFPIQISDASLRYLPRSASIQVPAKLAAASDPASVFNPQTIVMYATSGAPLSANWSVVRASVVNAANQQPLGNAVLRVSQTSDNSVLTTGMSDARGEALLAVPGLGARPSSNGGGAVVETSTAVSIQAFFDTAQPAGAIPNPDQLLANTSATSVKSATQSAQLTRGQSLSLSFSISV